MQFEINVWTFAALWLFAWACYEAASFFVRRKYPKSQILNEAAISHQFVWRMDKFIGDGDKLTIVGSDLFYLSDPKNGPRLQKALKKWLKKGCDINYISVLPNSDLKEIEFLNKQFSGLKGHLKAIIADPAQSELIEHYRTYHPTLLSDAEGKAKVMWIEHDHQPKSTVAFGIEYIIHPEIHEEHYSKRFENYRSDVDKLSKTVN